MQPSNLLTLAFLFATHVSACLTVTGTIQGTGKSKDVVLYLKDNGVATCSGGGDSSNTLGCKIGYWAWYYIADESSAAGPLSVQYQTPHGNFEFTVSPTDCFTATGQDYQCSYNVQKYC